MKEQTIRTIIDTYLKKYVDIELNKLPKQIEIEMADPYQDKREEWRIWHAIPSKVTERELEDLEVQIGHKLPLDYKTLLKHKHFYELEISEASFCSHPINTWRARQVEMIFDSYPTEFLIEKGYLPLAGWSDWGVLCFDTNRNNKENNYPIVLWDHEIANQVEDAYEDFYDLIIRLDIEGRKTSANSR